MGKQHKHASGRSPHAAYGPFRPGGILQCRLRAPRPWASHTCFWAASLPSESIGYVPGAVLQPVVRGGRPLLSREGGRKGKRLRVQAASVTRKEVQAFSWAHGENVAVHSGVGPGKAAQKQAGAMGMGTLQASGGPGEGGPRRLSIREASLPRDGWLRCS